MKHRFPYILVAAVSAVLLLIAVGSALLFDHRAAMQTLLADSVIRIGGQDSPPYYFSNGSGGMRGPVYDIINEAAKRRRLKITWTEVPKGPVVALSSGMVDIWPLMGRLDSRLLTLDITRSWLDLSYVLVCTFDCESPARPGQPPVTVAHRGSDLTRDLLQGRFPSRNEWIVRSHAEALEAICTGKATVALITEVAAAGGPLTAPQECEDRSITLRLVPVRSVGFGIGSRPESFQAQAAATILRHELDRMIDDGTVGGILLRWGVSSGEIRALRAASLANQQANRLLVVAAVLLVSLIVLAVVYQRLRRIDRERARMHTELMASQAVVQEEFQKRRELESWYHHSQKMESLGRMAGGVAHDFNNLLTVINGYGEMALEQAQHPAQREYVQQVLSAGRRAADLTGQLLAFSRHRVIEALPVDLNQTVRETAPLLQRLLGAEIELVLALQGHGQNGGDIQTVRADAGQLSQVLMNLASNAKDALPQGGRVRISTSRRAIAADTTDPQLALQPGSYAVLEINDNGAGMDEQTRKYMFEPFFTTKPPGKGTGLGLATVYGVVKQAGGEIRVQSDLGKGTTISLYLPEVVPAPPLATTANAHIARQGGATVLVVEDQDEVRRFLVTALRERRYQVLEAADGESALSLFEDRADGIDLIVSDVLLHGLSGLDLVRRLREIRQSVKVLLISGYSDKAALPLIDQPEHTDYLAKPFGPGYLCDKVAAMLGKSPATA